jgi:hypothetical protein
MEKKIVDGLEIDQVNEVVQFLSEGGGSLKEPSTCPQPQKVKDVYQYLRTR